MSQGLVYLRPVPVVYVRRRGPQHEAAALAWTHLLDWLDRRKLRSRIDRGYGLARHNARLASPGAPGDAAYDACVAATDGVDADPDAGISLQIVPGGSYLRRRHRAGMDTIGDAFTDLCAIDLAAYRVAIDPSRPLLEVYFDQSQGDALKLRVDIGVPVRPA